MSLERLQVPYLSTAQRIALTPLAKDILLDTDLNKLYVGDGSTVGGVSGYGADGVDGADGVSIVWHGAYASTHSYIINDAVSYQDSSYICILASTDNLPTNGTYWNVVALKGVNGIDGADGAAGTDGVMASVVAGTGISVDSADPANPIVALSTGAQASINAGLQTLSTGWVDGCQITKNVDDVYFDMSAGTLYFIDRTNPLIPVLSVISVGALTHQTVTNLSTWHGTYLGINSSGTIVHQETQWTNTQTRTITPLAFLFHADHTKIKTILPHVHAVSDVAARFADFVESVGIINLAGNQYTANGANLKLNKSVGASYALGANAFANPLDPDCTVDPVMTPMPVCPRSRRDGLGGWTQTSHDVLDTTYFDDGHEAVEEIPTDYWVAIPIFYIPGVSSDATGGARVQYPQQCFATKELAKALLPDPQFLRNPNLSNGTIRTYCVVKKGTTDLSDTALAEFIHMGKYDGTVAGSGSGAGAGDFYGAESSVTDHFVSFENTTGKKGKDSGYGAASFAAALGVDDNYVTDAEKVVIGNTSGTNTGDSAGHSGLAANGANTDITSVQLSNAGLNVKNPAGTFKVQITPSAEVADRVLTIPLLGAADTLETLGLAQTITGVKTFASSTIKQNNPAGTFAYTWVPAAIAAARTINLPLLTGTDTMAVLDMAQAFTGANTHSGLNAMLVSSAGLTVRNPANTFRYTLTAAAIVADRILNLPLTTATDTLATLGLAQTFTAIQTIGNITLPTNGQVLHTIPTTDGHATGPTINAFNCGYTSSVVGDLVYLDSASTWQKANAAGTILLYSGMLGIALEVKSTGQALLVAMPGSFVYATAFPALTVGSPVYMGVTAGAVQVAQPTATDQAIRVVGFAVHADKLYFNPSPDYLIHA